LSGISNWFTFESAKERRKREERYYHKMFPMGEDQKKWERDMMAKLFPKKRDIRPYLYELLVLREALIAADQPGEDDDETVTRAEVIELWEKKKMLVKIDEESKNRIKTMAVLEHDSKSMEDMPLLETILACGKEQ